MMYVRVCACGTDVVVLCAGLPAGTEVATAAAAAETESDATEEEATRERERREWDDRGVA